MFLAFPGYVLLMTTTVLPAVLQINLYMYMYKFLLLEYHLECFWYVAEDTVYYYIIEAENIIS